MVVNDPIADMLTRIRNAQIARHDSVVIPASNIKKAIAKILIRKRSSPSSSASSASPSPVCGCTPPAKSCPRCWAAWASPSFPLPRA